MNKRVNDIRRVILALCFFGLVLSLLGTELPWVKISQSKPENPIYIIDKPNCQNITYTPSPTDINGSTHSPQSTLYPAAPTITTLEFTLDVYLTLLSSQLCQTFTKGSIPPPIDANLKDIRMCTDTQFDQISNFMVDVSVWDSYSSDCSSAGSGTFALIIFSLLIISITMIINTFPKTVQKCCSDQNSFKAKLIRSFIALLAPLFVTLGLIIYSVNCLNGDIGDILSLRKMSRSGDGGYYLCCISCAFLWIYWGLFVFRMCDNDVPQIDFKTGDIKAKFLKKNRKKQSDDVDAGMISEEQEHNETIVASGAYDEDTYKKYDVDGDNNNDEQDNDTGGGASGIAAGSWRDVEED